MVSYVAVIMIMTCTVIMIMIKGCNIASSYSFHMVVMALLYQAHLRFEPQHLLPILTELTIHIIFTLANFFYSFHKRFNYQGMVVQVRCFNKFNIRMSFRNNIRVFIYTAY